MAEQAQTRSDDEAPEVGGRGLLPPQRQHSPIGWVMLALAIVALAAGGWWYQRNQVPAAAPEVQALPVPAARARRGRIRTDPRGFGGAAARTESRRRPAG